MSRVINDSFNLGFHSKNIMHCHRAFVVFNFEYTVPRLTLHALEIQTTTEVT